MILVTGASGHLGANLVRRLLADHAALRLLARPGTDGASFCGLTAEIVEAELGDLDAIRRAVRGVQQIYHCAAQISTHRGAEEEIFRSNILGTRNLLLAAREAGVERVVVTGTLSASGYRADGPTNESDPFNPLGPHLPYAHSKAAVEHECLKAYMDGLQVVIAVSSGIVGPYDFGPSRVGCLLQRFARGRMLAYMPGGFEMVAMRDIVEGHILAMAHGRPGQKYIFSTRFVTCDELMEMLARITGRRKPRLRLSPSLMNVAVHLTEPILRHLLPATVQLFTPYAVRLLRLGRRADCSKARAELGYRPTDIESALEEAYRWLVDTGRIEPRPAVLGAVGVQEG
jgi:nucleoside-diphosphate-sugar epimerase